jgi:hypothetical protein
MAARDASGKFIKGESGNPGGRPASELSITALIDSAVTREDWDFIIKQLLKQARRGNLKAIEMLMDRRFGKPAQQLQHSGELEHVVTMIEIVKDAGVE